MAIPYDAFEYVFTTHFDTVWRFCYLSTGSIRAAEDLTFRAFLVQGAEKNATFPPEAIIFRAACQLIQHWYAQKLRHRPTRKRLDAMTLPFPVDDTLLRFLRRPSDVRMCLLLHQQGFSETDSAAMLHTPRWLIRHRLRNMKDTNVRFPAVQPPADLKETLSDRIYTRFAERSVGVENSIHQAGRTFERIAPWLALVVIALFIVAYLYADQFR